jgi:hypothetical protein
MERFRFLCVTNGFVVSEFFEKLSKMTLVVWFKRDRLLESMQGLVQRSFI